MITAKDIMRREVICVSPEMEIQEVACLFREKMISGAPVIDEEGYLLGIVSTTDLAYYLAQPAEGEMLEATNGTKDMREFDDVLDESERRWFHIEDYSHRATVRDIMTTPVLWVDEDCSLVKMIHMMAQAKVRRLIVVRNHTVVGIVTALDIIAFWAARLVEEGGA